MRIALAAVEERSDAAAATSTGIDPASRKPSAYAHVFPPPPYGSASTSGAEPSSSTSSNAAVFWPSSRYGLSEFTRTCVPREASSRAASSAWSNEPRTSRSRAPAARACASFPSATAPAGWRISAGRPARAAYAAADAAVFPVDAHTTASASSSTAFVIATVMPRSLKLPVGFAPSHFRSTCEPIRSDRESAGISGVDPSPSEMTRAPGPTGSRSAKRSTSGVGHAPRSDTTGKAVERARVSGSASISASAAASAPDAVTWVTTCSVASPSPWC